MNRVVLAELTTEPLDVAAHEAAVADPRAGAVVSFAGVVRDHDHGRSVATLTYESHPSAADVLREVAQELADDPDVYAVAVSHRYGPLKIGDVALACAVSTAHRAAAFTACARLVDLVKQRLPIWKHQTFTDGTDEWVNCP
ncbi:molybdenum cofactor biosynthesis protein MoaE [Catellatospora aurea]|uniref:Molybdenum cofactor biosynthesis protein MoaE n=1 Tax=Catellatospora aurea TaxID=1337874 RepID=A0ABW2GYR9_9ACTN